MAVFNEPNQWEHPLGNNADASTLPDDAAATAGIASLQKLFQIINATPLEAGGIAPDREDVNALFKYLGDQIFYTQNGGIPSYNAAYDYIPGRVVLYDNNLYKCIQANGVSSTVVIPNSDTAYWQRVALNNELADYLPLVGGNITDNLTVQNKNVVRSVNGVEADAGGNVQTGFPGSTFINVDFSTNPNFTAPANGFLNVGCKALSASEPSSFGIIFDNRTVNHWMPISQFGTMSICTPVRKGETCYLAYASSVFDNARFIYAEGEI